MQPPTLPWLVLIHQLPPRPAYLRVKVWRRLQALGAVAIKNSVYVLPNRDETREDFEWILREIQRARGDASLCEARLVDGMSDDQVRASFQAARERDYRALATEVRKRAHDFPPSRGRSLAADERLRLEAAIGRLRKRLAEIVQIDFFGAPGRESVEGLLRGLEERASADPERTARPGPERPRIADVRKRTWVTRKGVHVDRMASAWLIRRFIDGEATFKFVQNRGYVPAADELRFDMFEAEFTHDGDLCTFEVLLRDFGIEDPALRPVAEIVHDIDLKEAKFGRPEVPGMERLIAGIAWATPDDTVRVSQSAAVFDALYVSFRRRNP